jgi:hypothetical protein
MRGGTVSSNCKGLGSVVSMQEGSTLKMIRFTHLQACPKKYKKQYRNFFNRLCMLCMMRFLQRWLWSFISSGTPRRVVRRNVISNFRAEKRAKQEPSAAYSSDLMIEAVLSSSSARVIVLSI